MPFPEPDGVHAKVCPSCGGEIPADKNVCARCVVRGDGSTALSVNPKLTEVDVERLADKMTTGTPLLDAEADSLCTWAASRAGVIALVPVVNNVGLLANEVYLVTCIGRIYGVQLSTAAVKSFIWAFSAALLGRVVASFVPFPPLHVGIAVTFTWALGQVAKAWIKDGMPKEMGKYLEMLNHMKKAAEKRVEEIRNDPRRDQPLGDESKQL